MKSFRTLVLLVLSALCALSAQAQSTMVRLHSTQGPIDFKLLDTEAPATVANFLTYVRGGDYTNVFFHRSIANFVIQAGGFKWPQTGNVVAVATRPPVQNEFSLSRSNIRGTVAMAKVGNDPNSATSQWFINMNNNAANLDNQNGGFSVFARVTTPSMAVADSIASLQVVCVSSQSTCNPNTEVFGNLPVSGWQSGTPVTRPNVVRFTEVTEFPANPSQSDRIFNYLEAAYPQYLSPSKGSGGIELGYIYRYYSGSNAYVGTKDGKVWYLVPAINNDINELGSMADWLNSAQTNGY